MQMIKTNKHLNYSTNLIQLIKKREKKERKRPNLQIAHQIAKQVHGGQRLDVEHRRVGDIAHANVKFRLVGAIDGGRVLGGRDNNLLYRVRRRRR